MPTSRENEHGVSEQLMSKIAQEAATSAVSELFLKLGIDTSDPLAMQRDMQALRKVSTMLEDPETAMDRTYLRELRKTSESIKSKTMLTVIGILVTGFVSATVIGLKAFFGPAV